AAEILEGTEHLGFTHPTLRAAVYQALPPAERSLLHHRAAGLLVSEGADPDVVAAHLLRCAPTASDEVARRLRDAAGVALARGAPEAAVGYIARALDEGPGNELLAELLALRERAEAAGREDAAP